MKRSQLVTLSLTLLCLVVSACGLSTAEIVPDAGPPILTAEPAVDSPASTAPPDAIPSKQQDLAGAEAAPEEIIEQAKTNLMEHLGVTAEQITFLDATPMDWPDTSIGCPQPGMMYAEVITPGYWILLEATGNQYRYHTDSESQVVLCQEEFLPSFPVTPGEIDDGQPWMPVN